MAYTRLEIRGHTNNDDSLSLVMEGTMEEVIRDYEVFKDSGIRYIKKDKNGTPLEDQ